MSRTTGTIDLVDETFVVADPAVVAAWIAEPARWRQWWPELELTVFMDRGTAGIRWSVTGALVGSSEVWLEPFGDGVIVHYYLRCDPAGHLSPTASTRVGSRLGRRHALAWKRHINALKDELEAGRRPGTPLQGHSQGSPHGHGAVS